MRERTFSAAAAFTPVLFTLVNILTEWLFIKWLSHPFQITKKKKKPFLDGPEELIV
jgi:hypothetical protein